MNKKLIKKNVKKWLRKTDQGDLNITTDFESDFQYDESDDTINIGDYDNHSNEFMKLNKKLGLKKDYNEATLSFLHELGHYHTHENYGDLAEWYDNKVRAILYKMIDGDYEKIVDIGIWLYYKLLPQEIEATKWGVEYANKHPRLTKELEKALMCGD